MQGGRPTGTTSVLYGIFSLILFPDKNAPERKRRKQMAQVNLEIVLLRRFSHGFRRDVAPEVLHGDLAQLAFFAQLSNRLIDGFQ